MTDHYESRSAEMKRQKGRYPGAIERLGEAVECREDGALHDAHRTSARPDRLLEDRQLHVHLLTPHTTHSLRVHMQTSVSHHFSKSISLQFATH